MTEEQGMKNYGAELTNARANAGGIVLYQHEELSLIEAIKGLKALRSARKAFSMVNPDTPIPSVYDEGQIAFLISEAEKQLRLCQQRIQNMKETFNSFTGMTWREKVEQNVFMARAPNGWTREEDEANGTILLTKED